MKKATIALGGLATAKMTEQGQLIVHQDADRAIVLQPAQAYELAVWLVDNHVHLLDLLAHGKKPDHAEE